MNTSTPGSRLTVNNGDVEIKIASDWYYQDQGSSSSMHPTATAPG